MRAYALLFVLAMVYIWDQGIHADETRVVCYYKSHARNRPEKAMFWPKDIDPRLCTHLIYGFANLTDEYELKSDDLQEEFISQTQFTDLRKKNKNVKILLSVGGKKHVSNPWINMAATPYGRKKFANQSIAFLRIHGYDGLDVAWLTPTMWQQERFNLLLKELNETYDAEAKDTGKTKLLLTALVSGKTKEIEAGYNVTQIQEHVEFLSVMAFFYTSGTNQDWVQHNAALYKHKAGSPEFKNGNVQSTLETYTKLHVDKDKLNIGLCASGVSFTLHTAQNDHLLDSAIKGGGAALWGTQTKGMVSYFEVCEMINTDENVTVSWIDQFQVPRITRGDQWYGYDNEKSITLKIEYIKKKGFQNIMFYTLDTDDFNGTFCGNETFPLLRAARTGLGLKNPVDGAITLYNAKTDHIKLFTFCISFIFYFV